MCRIPFLTIVAAALTALSMLTAAPANLTSAQTPSADHEQHHPGTPEAGSAATDPCVAGVATPATSMAQAGMMAGTPPMGDADMVGMMGQFDLLFIDMMIPHHASAVPMAQVALERTQHPEFTSLAQAIIDAQQREIEQMEMWREAWSGAATPAA